MEGVLEVISDWSPKNRGVTKSVDICHGQKRKMPSFFQFQPQPNAILVQPAQPAAGTGGLGEDIENEADHKPLQPLDHKGKERSFNRKCS